MNIENLKSIPNIGQSVNESIILKISKAVKASNDSIKIEINYERLQQELKTSNSKLESIQEENSRYNTWLANHNHEYENDTATLTEKFNESISNLNNLISNSASISDSITELANDIEHKQATVNASISEKSNLLENARNNFISLMGTLEDFVI